jgi:hypothetical protein
VTSLHWVPKTDRSSGPWDSSQPFHSHPKRFAHFHQPKRTVEMVAPSVFHVDVEDHDMVVPSYRYQGAFRLVL